MKQRLFWFDHHDPEDGLDADHAGDTSHFNRFEVDMVTSLVSHIVRQGAYRPAEIAVLTPYLGQFFKLRSAFSKIMQVSISDRDLDDAARQGYDLDEEQGTRLGSMTQKDTLSQALRIATVDNFQGEEAKVVVISLVRSNDQHHVGFLKTTNRINVLLSRAQHGMYVIGNSETASSVGMWSDVLDMLRDADCLGESLALQCPRHPDTPLEVSKAEDFVTISPEGGCELIYGDIDLDESPCTIPQCGHIATTETMDGMMGMADFYELSEDGKAVQLKDKDLNLTQGVPVCPTCRGSLRNINRYGRMVRRALLAEATKKFINWSNARYVPLAQQVQDLQERLSQSLAQVGKHVTDLKPVTLNLRGTSDKQIVYLQKSSQQSSRYQEVVTVYQMIMKYSKDVAVEEQPFRRVWELVQHKRRVHGVDSGAFEIDSGVMQTGQSMKASSLLLRCHLAVLCDFLGRANLSLDSTIDLTIEKAEAEKLAQAASEGSQPAIEVEAYVYYGRYCAAEQLFLKQTIEKMSVEGGSSEVIETLRNQIETLKKEGLAKIKQAQSVCQQNPGSSGHVISQVNEVEKMIKESTLHDVMLPHEMKAVFDAMSREFRGTGHWYRCTNGHLFTIGECGMPMQLARCPQCGAQIGGQSHQTVAGVARAQDLEEQMQRMRI
ncbi:hypothetical protein PMZ80_003183 [Knufia obscura]|uniref:RZ-type domain-containing protein n=1 Tax=Knufia obscura TaxID=1635080 RepID=A0ABR0RTI6_9EURO|nr:hypothetical protein PMZ80_003183 [Knufia obscura]